MTDHDEPDTATTRSREWRLRHRVGDLTHYTEWTSEFADVENFYEQYRRGDYGHEVVIERRSAVQG